jgi:hypothetical protein
MNRQSVQHEYEGVGRVKRVPQRAHNVVLERNNPTVLQHTHIIVASFNDEDRAYQECESRNAHATGHDGYYYVDSVR